MSRRGLRTIAAAATCLCVSTGARAQSRPTTFLHGFAAEASDWAATADRLRKRVSITPHLPSLPWREKYETQARQLQNALGSLPSNAVAVGHSNGGIVAREWSRLRALGGVVTIGAPHRGAPILANLPVWAAFSGTTSGLVGEAFAAFAFSTEWTWLLAALDSALRVTADFSLWSLTNLIAVLGVGSVTPVSIQMTPGSSYLSGLNSSSNLSQEASRAPNRVGIVSVASNFYYAGPARALVPQSADRIAETMYAISSALLFWGNYILVRASPTDTRAIDQALALIAVADQILAIDPTYCLMVSSPNLSTCIDNDGLLPVTTQTYPGAPNLYSNGPAHREETQRSDDALYAALVNYMRLAPVSTSTPPPTAPPPPPPAPPPSPPPPSSDPPPPPPEEDSDVFDGEFGMGAILRAGEMVDSENGRYHLIYQPDGNVVLYDGGRDGGDDWTPMWETNTDGRSTGMLILQHDGNLVLYDGSNRPIWSSDTFRTPCVLIVQNDGNVVIYDGNGVALWAVF